MAQQRLAWVNPTRWTDIRAVPTGPRARWQHPQTGEILFNPKPNPDKGIYPVWEGGEKPSPLGRNVIEHLAFDNPGQRVVLTYSFEWQPMLPILERRIAELKARAEAEGAKGAGPWDRQALGLAQVYALEVQTFEGDPDRRHLLADRNGAWHELTDQQVRDLSKLYADRQRAILAATRHHSEALRALAQTGTPDQVLGYSIDSRWPE